MPYFEVTSKLLTLCYNMTQLPNSKIIFVFFLVFHFNILFLLFSGQRGCAGGKVQVPTRARLSSSPGKQIHNQI